MAYDLEKYRDKREKVLGVKKRGISFGTLALIVSMTIVVGLGLVVIPKSIAYFHARHLEDAIYKVQGETVVPHEFVVELRNLAGVQEVVDETSAHRVVVTYNKSETDTAKILAFFRQNDLPVVLLNKLSHTQRMQTMKKEAEF